MTAQYFYGHGKLLLTSEYFVLDGAVSLALPTNLGQKMFVKHRPSSTPKLYWKSYDFNGNVWFSTSYELWHFNCLEEENEASLTLQTILRQARKQNIHFLRDDLDFYVETKLEFPLNWGLGSSSTLVYNIAQWAYVSPFELLAKSFGGSGYDIACAQSMGPITYQLQCRGPHWETVKFAPHFKDNIYFVYLNKKQNSREGIDRYRSINEEKREETIKKLNSITEKMITAIDLQEFEQLVCAHENLISNYLDLPRVKDIEFSDFDGTVKSLGAWGGDFVMVTSKEAISNVRSYFNKRGFDLLFTFDEMILQNFGMNSHATVQPKNSKVSQNVNQLS